MGEERLRAELANLRQENEQLRERLGLEPAVAPPQATPTEEARAIRVLLHGESGENRNGERPTIGARVAEEIVPMLRQRQPEVEWRVETDLERVPKGAACHQLGEVALALWDGGRIPPTYAVEHTESDGLRLRRCVVDGEPASAEFSAGLEAVFAVFDDLVAEGSAAVEAGAGHHAGWSLKAMDVVLARINLARVSFECGEEGWREVLREPRPEYEMGIAMFVVEPNAPVGQ